MWKGVGRGGSPPYGYLLRSLPPYENYKGENQMDFLLGLDSKALVSLLFFLCFCVPMFVFEPGGLPEVFCLVFVVVFFVYVLIIYF